MVRNRIIMSPTAVILIAYPHGPYRFRKGVEFVKKFLNALFHAREMIKVNAAMSMPVSVVSEGVSICIW